MSSSMLTSSFKLQNDFKMSSRHHTKCRGRRESDSLRLFLWNKETFPRILQQTSPFSLARIGSYAYCYTHPRQGVRLPLDRSARPLPWSWEQSSLPLMHIAAWGRSGWQNKIMVLLKWKLKATQSVLCGFTHHGAVGIAHCNSNLLAWARQQSL